MKKTIASGILLIGLLCVTSPYFAKKSARSRTPSQVSQPTINAPMPLIGALREPAAAPVAALSVAAPRVLALPDKSLEAMGHTLGQIGQPSFTLNGLLEDLQRSGQQPLVVHDENPDSGEMLIVRTKSPLPGTRYFHAQYFTDESGERFVQHMSFEFKPGADSMSEAISTVERNFAGLSRPVVQRPDYVKWKLDNHYIVWIKRMAAADLQEDPFNSYSLSDDGTIRVAVELEIHGD